MKAFSVTLVAVWIVVGGAAWAARPEDPKTLSPKGISTAELTPTPEMWFYQEYLKQYDNPKLAVRRKAELQAEARERRLAALRWFGYSNSRPRAGIDPVHGDYSPGWSSNNLWFPYRWNGFGPAWLPVMPVEAARSSR
jgi:hypothetical protein